MRLVCNVMVLANVNSLVVVPAVVPVITHRLHVDLLACFNKLISERSTAALELHNSEVPHLCLHSVL